MQDTEPPIFNGKSITGLGEWDYIQDKFSISGSFPQFKRIDGVYDYSPPINRLDGEDRELSKRLNSGINDQLAVCPMNERGMYTVISFSIDESKESVDDVTLNQIDLLSRSGDKWHPVCRCSDYRYRCASTGLECKHILATKHRINNGINRFIEERMVDWVSRFEHGFATTFESFDGFDTVDIEFSNTGNSDGLYTVSVSNISDEGVVSGFTVTPVETAENVIIHPPVCILMYVQMLLIGTMVESWVSDLLCGIGYEIDYMVGDG